MKKIKNYLKDLKTKLVLKYHSCNGYFGNYVCIDHGPIYTLDNKGKTCAITSSSTYECKICGHIEHVD